MALLTKDQILSADDIKSAIVKVPEWGGEVRVRAMNASERDEFELKHIEKTLKDYRAYVASKCIVNDENQQVFSPQDIRELGKKSSAALSRVYNKATELSGFTEQDIEDLEKS